MCMFLLLCVFFFFKQKTAYEMRISDWSSDVCSSDLSSIVIEAMEDAIQRAARARYGAENAIRAKLDADSGDLRLWRVVEVVEVVEDYFKQLDAKAAQKLQRSEEHTSELQSLMRISYAVFCLKKKHNTEPHRTISLQ